MPNGYPNPTRYPVFSSIPDPTRFNFENHRVAGNPKYRVLPEISGNTRSFGYYPKFRVLPDVSGCKLFVNYPEYPELPGNTRNTRNYPRVKKIPENTRSYFSTLLPDPNPTRYPVFFPIPDPTRPDIEKPYPLGTDNGFICVCIQTGCDGIPCSFASSIVVVCLRGGGRKMSLAGSSELERK